MIPSRMPITAQTHSARIVIDVIKAGY